MIEYVIWGITPGATDEQLLIAMPDGKPITDKALAERLKTIMETKHGCRKCRIQCIDGTLPEFAKAIRGF